MRLFAGLIVVVASLLVLWSAVGRLPWWDAGFPLLILLLSLTSIRDVLAGQARRRGLGDGALRVSMRLADGEPR
jgi:hypothetical protein